MFLKCKCVVKMLDFVFVIVIDCKFILVCDENIRFYFR